MPNVQIRNVPDDVHRRLKQRAANAGQSLNEYMLEQMRAVASLPTMEEIADRLPKVEPYDGPSMAEIAQIVREDRDSH